MQIPVPGKYYIDTEGIRRQVMMDSPDYPVVIPDEPAVDAAPVTPTKPKPRRKS